MKTEKIVEFNGKKYVETYVEGVGGSCNGCDLKDSDCDTICDIKKDIIMKETKETKEGKGMRFKVGDKVRRINCRNISDKGIMKIGDIGHIEQILPSSWLIIKEYRGVDEQNPKNFELVEDSFTSVAGYTSNEGITYEFREFSLIDLFEKKPTCSEWDKEFLELMKDIVDCPIESLGMNDNLFAEDEYPTSKEAIEECYPTLTKPKCLKWLCDNGFVRVKDKQYKLCDYSALHDTGLVRVQGRDVFHNGAFPCCDLPKPNIKIIEEGLRIPYINIVNKTDYLDCMIEYNGERYYTKREFIREV